jgi:hypothetical protein
LGSGGYVPSYGAIDFGGAIIDLVAGVIVGVAGRGNMIGQAFVVLLIVSMIGGIGMAVLVSVYHLFKPGDGVGKND